MIATPATWADLEVGAYMRDAKGGVWKVERERDGHFGIVNRQGKKAILKPRPAKTPVTMMTPSSREGMDAMNKVLGAHPIEAVSTDGEKSWICRRWPEAKQTGRFSLDNARFHLFFFHGEFAEDIPNYLAAIECHTECEATVAHTHK